MDGGSDPWFHSLVPLGSSWMCRVCPLCAREVLHSQQAQGTPEEEGKKSSARFFLAEKLPLQNYSNVNFILYK